MNNIKSADKAMIQMIIVILFLSFCTLGLALSNTDPKITKILLHSLGTTLLSSTFLLFILWIISGYQNIKTSKKLNNIILVTTLLSILITCGGGSYLVINY